MKKMAIYYFFFGSTETRIRNGPMKKEKKKQIEYTKRFDYCEKREKKLKMFVGESEL